MNSNSKKEKNEKLKNIIIDKIKDLHEDDAKVKILEEIIDISKSINKITVSDLSKKLNHEIEDLETFLEELILTEKINAKKENNVIFFL
ncbi:MAG: PCI domain-containing protein [Candidatus Helarchaeota archaeon]